MEEKEGLLDGSTKEEDEGAVVVARNGSRYPSSKRRVLGPLPLGVWLLERLGCCAFRRRSYRVAIYILTFCCYTTYHLSRKPISVVKVVLCPECGGEYNTSNHGWPPFNGDHGKTLLGSLDYSYLFAYALSMYFSGWLADRMNLRVFLTMGMLGSGITVALMGVAYNANIHHISYFIVVQLLGGMMQSTGWPGVVAVMSHWFGKSRRGFIMGVWNAHTSVGNILGTIIPSFWADSDDRNSPWGWSFYVPAFIIAAMGVITFFFLVTDPAEVGLPPPVHHLNVQETDLEEDDDEEENRGILSEEQEQTPIVTPETSTNNNGDSDFEDGQIHLDDDQAFLVNGTANGDVKVYVEPEAKPPSPEQRPKQDVQRKHAVGFLRVLMIPGVIEYSIALFFNKLVSYTFLYWLPIYVSATHHGLKSQEADWISTLFDVGGIFGGILIGTISDWINARAITCVVSLILAIPSLFFLRFFGDDSLALYIVLLFICGLVINGPYGIITTAVSSDLGTHKSLRGNQNAKATVTAIIDGTGSMGAALGPLLFGWISDDQGWSVAFYVLMGSCFLAAMFLMRLVTLEVTPWIRRLRCVQWL